MPGKRELDLLFAPISDRLFVPSEYICLPNFLVAGSDVVAESADCTVFNVRKIYGWDGFSDSYSLCLFDADLNPTVGVWQDNCLTLYQDVPLGYMRLSYLVKKTSKLPFNGDLLSYSFFVDLSCDGVYWHRYSRGEYRAG